MTDKQKEDFRDWLTNNMQFTSVSRVQHVIDHVEHYFCPTPSPGDNQSLEDTAEKYADGLYFKDSREYHTTHISQWRCCITDFLAGAAYVKGGEEKHG